MFVNNPDLLDETYQRFTINHLGEVTVGLLKGQSKILPYGHLPGFPYNSKCSK
jgi:hypothetical protein